MRLLRTMSAVRENLSSGGVVPKLLLKTEEAAQVLGVSRTQNYHPIQDQLLESVPIGGSRRIPLVCLNAYVDRLRRERQALVRP